MKTYKDASGVPISEDNLITYKKEVILRVRRGISAWVCVPVRKHAGKEAVTLGNLCRGKTVCEHVNIIAKH